MTHLRCLLSVFVCSVLLGAPVIAKTLPYTDYHMDDNSVKHFHKGQAWMARENYDAAIKEFQLAIRLKPASAMAANIYNNLGLAYLQSKRFPLAIVSFQQAIEMNPNFSLYYENLVKAYQVSGGFNQALEQLNQTTLDNPEDAQAWYLLGLLYREEGNTIGAQDAFSAYVRLAPHSAMAGAAKTFLNESSQK